MRMAKKDLYKFTIQFNSGDPQHQQTSEILNRQGRRKAQFLVNAVMHYLHCSETPNIPQPAPVDTAVIETIVRRIISEQHSEEPTMPKPAERKIPKSKDITFDQDEADMLGEDGMAAIANTMAMFRRG